MRRGVINNWAHEHGCNKVALGHHMDDVIETLLMSMFYEGRIQTFAPCAYLTRSEVTVIRPMVYVAESTITKSHVSSNYRSLSINVRQTDLLHVAI